MKDFLKKLIKEIKFQYKMSNYAGPKVNYCYSLKTPKGRVTGTVHKSYFDKSLFFSVDKKDRHIYKHCNIKNKRHWVEMQPYLIWSPDADYSHWFKKNYNFS